MIDEAQIQNWFTYHAPSKDQQVIYETIRAHAREFAHIINQLVPDGPDKTTAIRTLREAVMWANAAVATHTEDATPPAHLATPVAAVRKTGTTPYQTSTWPLGVKAGPPSVDKLAEDFVAGLKTATR